MSLILMLGLLIGIRHAMESDHIAALLAFSSQSRSVSVSIKQGTIWGYGHTITLMMFSMTLMVFEIKVDQEVFIWFELMVGIVLILMGVELISKTKTLSDKQETYKKSKFNLIYFIFNKKISLQYSCRAFGIGLIHGATGSGVVIVLATIMLDSAYLKIGYVIVFSIGLIIGGAILSILLSTSLKNASKKITSKKLISVFAGLTIVFIGTKLIYNIYENFSLFII